MSIFNKISGKRLRSNSFDLSHEKKMSFNMGELIPHLIQEIVPGDRFRVNSEVMMRLAPMLAPVMHRVNVFTHFFFVPNRLIWNEWEDFITGGKEGNLKPALPSMTFNETRKANFYKGNLPDYFGIPTTSSGITNSLPIFISALPFRAYQLIYDQYYRDQNLTNSIDINLGSHPEANEQTKLIVVRKRAWEKDYFTSCLPWAQRGGDVELPIDAQFTPSYMDRSALRKEDAGVPNDGDIKTEGGLMKAVNGENIRVENLMDPQVIESTGITINDLRLSVRLQEWLEKNARGGARYIEQIMSHFGVRSSDARLQRAEFLGGGKTPIVISEVLQTTHSDDPDLGEVGSMAGHGLSVGNSNRFTKRFEEHGHVFGIVSVLPRTAYQQGVEKIFTRFDKLDYYWPEFANLGEQEVKNKEIYYKGMAGDKPEGTFGYQSRYAEYKYKQSSVHGDFRDDFAFWHLGRIFATEPALNTEFVESDPDHRIFAVDTPGVHKLWAQIYNNVKAIRPMPKFGTPTL
ncbi:hypothetical protein ES705_27902 [subsurface metagenome]